VDELGSRYQRAGASGDLPTLKCWFLCKQVNRLLRPFGLKFTDWKDDLRWPFFTALASNDEPPSGLYVALHRADPAGRRLN
jgi:hypothetical protein